ncbi:putative disease resistance protein At1g50180 [Abrus precatorius]|uniref:Disease resistance protein At1g50180 n=1 Tax=Abrus precatorius TaxID=3816 RepID=A0A8B8JZE8_ABRPR|nr:putative disease resistance protein At1g50180 [Abrus precatorius]
MADSVVAFLLDHLSQLLAHEAKLLSGVEDRIRSLHNELEMINEILKTFGRKKHKSEIEQTVVNQIRDVAYEAEDVVDTFIANVAAHKKRSILERTLHVVNHAKLLRHLAEKIDKTKATINEICQNRIKYLQFQEGEEYDREDEERVQSLHERRRNVEENEVVGFFRDSKQLITRLVEGGSARGVVSIIGMGGLGKTTLARKVYNSNEVKQHFDVRAWVYASNDCRARELMLGLLKHLMQSHKPRDSLSKDEAKEMRWKSKKHKEIIDKLEVADISSLSKDEMKGMLREYLKKKRYLLVLDDLWKTQDWDEVKDAFPNDTRGSRILITSRLKEVASHTSRDPPYLLPFLNEEESWELFSKKVFRGEEYPVDLVPLGKKLVESCRGLPLSIVVLAGLLANKEKSQREWSKVVGHVNWYLTRDETRVKDILKLSYDNLPKRLKPCFVYFGIFLEDSEIPVRPLLERWVAEGFIQESGSRDPEDVAEDYLYELIDRSLVQVARLKVSGGVKKCRIHDLLRDLCISESEKDKVFEVCMDTNVLTPTKPRRLSIHCSINHYISSNNNNHSCVRSLFYLDNLSYKFSRSEWEWLFKGFKLVRVLDLGRNLCNTIPSNVGGFIHLRFPTLEVFQMKKLAVRKWTLGKGSMPRLQSLLIDKCHWLDDLPSEIWFLTSLRKVQIQQPSQGMARMLRIVEVMDGCKLVVE